MPHFWKTMSLGISRMLGIALAKLSPSEIEDIAYHYLSGAKSTHSRAMGSFAREIANPTRGVIYDAALNGEGRLIERTRGLGFSTMFDVGANQGDWASRVREFHPDATIHCFEILPSTFARLERRLARMERVVLNPFGLSDKTGQVQVHVGDNSYISSMYDFLSDRPKQRVSCQVMRGDEYAEQKGISQIDLVKIDVEGADGSVLKGLDTLFDKKRIRLVQFEYNRGAIESHFLLIDFYRFFSSRGYLVGKLTQKGVDFREYHYALEDFMGPNYVACSASDHDVIKAVSAT